MKNLLLCLLAGSLTLFLGWKTKSENKIRCFLIGYVGTTNGTGKVWTGGIDTCAYNYPNLYQLVSLFAYRHKLHDVRILSISEYSVADREVFWRQPKPMPSPIPDTTKPKYQYFQSSKIETPTLYSSYDSINLVLNQLGRTLSVDDANNLRQIATRNLFKVYGSFKIDSVKVK